MKFLLACLMLVTGAGAPAWAQDAPPELETDRPDKTENPHAVDAGRFQLEMDVATFTSDLDKASDTRTRTLNLAPFNLKYGIDRRTDVQLVFDSYLRESNTDRATGTRETQSGIGDLTIRLKRNLWGNDGGDSAMAVMPFIKLPTNTHGLGTGSVEFGLIAPLTVDLSDKVDLAMMTEIDLVEQQDGAGLTPSFVNSASLGVELTDKLGVYTELFTEKRNDDPDWAVTFDLGATLKLNDDLELDAGANLGLTDAADDVMVFMGLSRRF